MKVLLNKTFMLKTKEKILNISIIKFEFISQYSLQETWA